MKLNSKPSFGKYLGCVLTEVSKSKKLRALVAGGLTAALAVVGLEVDVETSTALILAAMSLAGWGPTSTDTV